MVAALPASGDTKLQPFATFGWSARPTGVAATTDHRVFVNFPRWFANQSGSNSVAEIKDGELVPYPNLEWNSWETGVDTKDKFVCVQSVFVDHMARLWILDPAAAFLGNVTGTARLFQFDLATDTGTCFLTSFFTIDRFSFHPFTPEKSF